MSARVSPLTNRFEEALSLAVDVHRDDYRRGSTIPYVAHLLNVCGLVLADGGDEDEAIAALLHDALEDHPERVTPEVLRSRFGDAVLAIVRGCTDTPEGYAGGPKPPWKPRKSAYLEHLRTASASVRRVSLADKLDNLRSTVVDARRLGPTFWSRFHAGREDQLWYYRGLLDAYRAAGTVSPMLEEFAELIVRLDG